MTKEAAVQFVKAGVFPSPISIVEIVKLQDEFAHLPWGFNVSLLARDDTRENAATLFALLYDESTVRSMMREANSYRDWCGTKASVESQITELTEYLHRVQRMIEAYDAEFSA